MTSEEMYKGIAELREVEKKYHRRTAFRKFGDITILLLSFTAAFFMLTERIPSWKAFLITITCGGLLMLSRSIAQDDLDRTVKKLGKIADKFGIKNIHVS